MRSCIYRRTCVHALRARAGAVQPVRSSARLLPVLIGEPFMLLDAPDPDEDDEVSPSQCFPYSDYSYPAIPIVRTRLIGTRKITARTRTCRNARTYTLTRTHTHASMHAHTL